LWRCGASAPDHFHLQAGIKGFMPIDNEYDHIIQKFGELLISKDSIKVYGVNSYIRKFFAMESADITELTNTFNTLYSIFEQTVAAEEEPMLNILASYEYEAYRVVIFPRAKHRPSQYFAEGDANILLSPASVDFGGVFITPQEKDFRKITAEDITDIFSQVSISDSVYDEIKRQLYATK